MRVIDTLEEIQNQFPGAVVTIGNFDGVHIGHQSLFHEVIAKAESIRGTAIAITFNPHPARVIKENSHPPLITIHEQKVELIGRSGMDVLITIPFTREFALITAQSFIRDLLVGIIGMKAVVVGRDYTFGRDREGNIELMKALSRSLGFEVIVSGWVMIHNNSSERISSTRIRELVMEGDVGEARKLLGRYYQIRGTVISGRNRGGRLLGFPTANIKLQDELCPKSGVYAVMVESRERCYKGVANIGYSPTFDDHLFTIEVHMIDFSDNIYGEAIKVSFVKRIREEIRFSGINELADQIRRDITEAKILLE
ncbi:MAG: riboflavin biosynthesis protein RibF [Deltaproteobacteria bacterium RBG_13_49_15]|nr:MAG: riboflavin biosynthesis protein RibF [Deltaproteobacteria bacterium RBG_13_49_15]